MKDPFNICIVDDDDIYQLLSLATPYMELIEELTLTEMLNFHFGFKQLLVEVLKN